MATTKDFDSYDMQVSGGTTVHRPTDADEPF
jgi:hypothetical protein